jgi:hypothetical protein
MYYEPTSRKSWSQGMDSQKKGVRGEAEEPKSGEGEAVEMLERGQLHFS